MNKYQQAEQLIRDAQMHFRYSRIPNRKRADYHKLMKKDCEKRAQQLVAEAQREERTAKAVSKERLPYK